ncbi:SDR family oxidoreductase [Noviherbaspirillum sp.]|uniref:SDR family oxidoreductase n=1 Tax=Noviherbaspirillum sp. TaxID=1926288 RepID=UPI002B474757|nr:SDR family oxidoreductase [Noviherbaspirillum sp.]HJV79994.1 SDR family oxidoreductase [Noviherbaspirillum sp.]
MDFGIAGKWALVCGASKGLGFGCAHALVREGVNVVLVARTAGPLEAAAEQLRAEAAVAGNPQVLCVAADITTEEGRATVFASPQGPGVDYDICVTNAAGPPPGNFRDWDRQAWLNALDGNMLTPIALIRAMADGMAKRGFGRIVNITSVAVKAPIGNLGLSNGARSGLTGFVAGVARSDLAARNVTINNLLPGYFSTERLRATIEHAGSGTGETLDTLLERQCATIPARRLGDPQEFGEICAFLCSRQASYITGQNILADGGAYPGTF